MQVTLLICVLSNKNAERLRHKQTSGLAYVANLPSKH